MVERGFAGRHLGPGRHQAQLFAGVVIALQGITAAWGTADGADEDDIVIIGLDGDITAFASAGDKAVHPHQRGFVAAAGDSDAAVVLLRSIDKVWIAIVGGHMIKLRCRLIEDA